MSRLSSIRLFTFAALLLVAAVANGEEVIDSDKVLLTVTNKSDSELSLRISMMPTAPIFIPPPRTPDSDPIPATPPAKNRVTEFVIGQIVQPREQVVLQIPKGNYMVQASTPISPVPSRTPVPRNLRPSNNLRDEVATNEVWTFEVESGPGGSLDPNDRVELWKRIVHPARPSKPVDQTGLRTIPTRSHRLVPGAALPQIPTTPLRSTPVAPTP